MTVPSWVWGSGGALVASAAVRALPTPAPMGNRFYLWFFNFTHGMLANWDKLGSPANLIVSPGESSKTMAAGK